jgi:lysozyme
MRCSALVPLVAVHGACAAEPTASLDQSSIACATGATVRGMDVSYYDTVADWNAAHASGIDFAFVRATDGTQYLDPDFATYWAGAKAAGVIRGAYQFFRPAEDPIAQADLLLHQIGTIEPGDLPPVLDVEVSGGLAPDAVAAAVSAWVAHVGAAIGRPPIVYAGLYSWPTLTGGEDMTTSPLWVAQYTTAPCPDIPRPWTQWTFWQDSATGSSPGVAGSGTLDLDVFAGTLDDLRAFAAAPPSSCGTIGAAGGEIDDSDPCFVAGGPPAYLREVTGAGERGTLVWTHATDAASESNFGQWNLVLAASGRYRLDVYTDHAYATSRQAAYEVYTAGSMTSVVIDQTAVDGWQSLGTFDLAAGGDQWVHLSDNTGEPAAASVQLVFDALRVTPLDPPPPPPPGGDGGVDPQPVAHGGGCSAGGSPGWLVMFALVVCGCTRHRRLRPS